MAENITATVGALYFATEQAAITGGIATAAAGKKKGSIRKKRQFFKNGLPVNEQEFYGLERGANIVKNPTSMDGITDEYIKKLMGW